uniref:Polynucleotidyl transferase, Ribonuclease H fold n=1 Tax=Medicago truncatula TaxID=3880 RepID=Q2HTF0_MEDTR|nr:Polynucleotidyl transferase, Ribonuclease H fold [Medicago truncatula]
MFGMSNFSHYSLLLVEAEAWGLFEAIKFALANDMTFVIFEYDCKVIVDIVNSSQMPQNEIGDILSNGLFGRREEDEREIWTREVGEKCFISLVWSRREIETID